MSDLYSRKIDICKGITVHVPTIAEILADDESYYSLVYRFIATPYDMMVQLADMKIDINEVNDFDLFCFMFPHLQQTDTSLILEGINFADFHFAFNEQTQKVILRDDVHDLTIDRPIHYQIAQALRKIVDIPRTNKRPGNAEALQYLVERERKRMKRNKQTTVSPLDNYIIALVNTAEFSYTYETVKELTLYQFNMSLKQIAHLYNYEHTMHGYYSGTIKLEDIPTKERSWILNRE